MTAPAEVAANRAQEGPCARCIIGGVLGIVVAGAMLFVTARLVGSGIRVLRQSRD